MLQILPYRGAGSTLQTMWAVSFILLPPRLEKKCTEKLFRLNKNPVPDLPHTSKGLGGWGDWGWTETALRADKSFGKCPWPVVRAPPGAGTPPAAHPRLQASAMAVGSSSASRTTAVTPGPEAEAEAMQPTTPSAQPGGRDGAAPGTHPPAARHRHPPHCACSSPSPTRARLRSEGLRAATAPPGSLRRQAPGPAPRPAARAEGGRRAGPRPVRGAEGAARPPPAGPGRHGGAAVRGWRGRLGRGTGLRRGGGAGARALWGLQERGRGAGQAAGAAREREQPGHGGQEVQSAALCRRYGPQAAVTASVGKGEPGGAAPPGARLAAGRRTSASLSARGLGRAGRRGAPGARFPQAPPPGGGRGRSGGNRSAGPTPVCVRPPSRGCGRLQARRPLSRGSSAVTHAVAVAEWHKWRLVPFFFFFYLKNKTKN